MSDIILIFVTHYNCFFSEDGSTRLLGYEYILIYSWLPDIRFRPPCGVLMHPLYFSSSGEQYVMQRVRTGPYFFPSLLCCMFMGDIYTVISYRTYEISDEIRRFRLILYVRKGKRIGILSGTGKILNTMYSARVFRLKDNTNSVI